MNRNHVCLAWFFLNACLCTGAEVVIGPKALEDFRDPGSLRADYLPVFTDEKSWPEVFTRTDSVKFYVANLDPAAGLDLPALVAMAERGGFKAEFEVGGLKKTSCPAIRNVVIPGATDGRSRTRATSGAPPTRASGRTGSFSSRGRTTPKKPARRASHTAFSTPPRNC